MSLVESHHAYKPQGLIDYLVTSNPDKTKISSTWQIFIYINPFLSQL